VTIVVTRDIDTPVECVALGNFGSTTCPAVAPDDYNWTGTVELTAPGNTNAWSTTIRRNGVDGGVVVWTGLLEDGDTHDFGPEGQPAGIAPAGGFTFTVTCNEMLGSGSCSDTAAASVPGCDGCGNVTCEDPLNPGEQIECPEGQTLNVLDCLCYNDGGCPDGTEFNGQECVPMCFDGKVWNGSACACAQCSEEVEGVCEPCDGLGVVLETGECSGEPSTRTDIVADGCCGTTEQITLCGE
jgi:hypothetical protein